MGAASRKRNGPCPCGSRKVAKLCCWTRNGWYKKPETISLQLADKSYRHPGCYLNSTSTCSSKISGEHYISENSLLVFGTTLEVSGFPWLNGQKKQLPLDALQSNCLCKDHNSALSDLDTQGGRLFKAIKASTESTSGANLDFLFSGHDIERWMLKSLAGLAAGKSLAVDGVRLDDSLIAKLRIADVLQDPSLIKPPAGMYMLQGVDHTFTRRDQMQVAPLLHSNDVIGIVFDIQGIHFGLVVEHRPGAGYHPQGYRPNSLRFQVGPLRNKIMFTWDDTAKHLSFNAKLVP